MFLNLVLVAAGGAMGAVLRFSIAGLVERLSSPDVYRFPFGTLSVNLIGCLLIGIGATYMMGPQAVLREPYRFLLLVGLLGGFTTFSTFGLESIELLYQKKWAWLFVYVLASNIGGLLLVWLGWSVTTRFSDV